MTTRAPRPMRAIGVALLFVMSACAGAADEGEPSGGARPGGALTGLFAVQAGKCVQGSRPAGSWFRMVRPGGSVAAGPFVANPDSGCADRSYTPLRPGADGGLRTGRYQPGPADAFDAAGEARADRIVEPFRWSGFVLGLSTNERDPQAKIAVPAPSLHAEGRVLRGDLRAAAVAWNAQHLNQGAPKPGGGRPGLTSGPHGAYDRTTRTYTLEWTSQIAGGQYNNFTGVWHFEGVFQPTRP